MGITTSLSSLATMPASVRARFASGSPTSPRLEAGSSADLQSRVDTFTHSPMTVERRDAALTSLTAMRDQLLADAEKAAQAPGQTKGIQQLMDEEFDTGLAEYDSHKSRVRGADPYLTDDDKAMVGLMYAKYEMKYGEGSPQLDKVDRFANELATLRGIGALVETQEDKEAAAARDARREERAEATAKREAAQEKSRAEQAERVESIEQAITDLQAAPVVDEASASDNDASRDTADQQ